MESLSGFTWNRCPVCSGLCNVDDFADEVGYEISVYELPPEGVDVEELTETTLEEGQGIVIEPEEFLVSCEIQEEEIPKEILIHTSCSPWDEEINDAYAKSGYVLEVDVTYELVEIQRSEKDTFARYKLNGYSEV